MTRLLAFAFVVITAAACGSKSSQPANPSGSGDGPPCAQEIARVCPDGQMDACMAKDAPATETHRCIPAASDSPPPHDPSGANRCTTEGGSCTSKAAAVACKRFEEDADYGCESGEGCCIN